MCDLIDLNSPDVRGVSDSAKLASPLIPVPKNDECSSESSSSATEKHENLGNNPFDTVLHETAEYISKKGDPFEMMLQRAMKFKSRKNTEHLKAQSVEFMDDFTPKRKKRYQKMMNKSLDVLDTSSLENKLGPFNGNRKEHEESVNMTTAVICDNNVTENASVPEKNHEIFATSPSLFELSLLDISAMDDTLSDTCFNSKANSDISSENALFKKFIFPSTAYLKPPNLQHSLSHKVERSPIKLVCLSKRSKSLTDGQKILQRVSDTSSCLDRAFVESKLSTFSSLSNVSSITKLTSTSISSSLLSNDTMNHAFLDTDLLGRTSQKKINTTENSEEIKIKQWDLSDLAEKLNKLKCVMNETSNVSNATENKSNSMKEENRQITNDKLIDVDVFIPEQNINKECNKSSISTSSSDSNTDKAHKSIIKEAKVLARTFEELALKTDSSASTNDDFISNNTLWMSELLPAFEDEPVVDNLIELPVSPEKSIEDSKNNSKKQSFVNIDENSLKETSSELSTSNIKQTIVTSLLSDLKKIVKTEDNPEANKLFNNLEKALNVNCKNNTELLMTYLNISNELQSPQKTLSEDVERSEKTNTDKNEEKNEKISDENLCNNEKLPLDINKKFGNTSETATVSDNSSSIKSSSCKDNSENDLDINSSKENTGCAEEENNQTDEKLAIELLMSLGKLLSGQTEDVTTMQLLKNIGKALNVVSNSSKIESEVQTDRKIHNVQQTSVKASESDRTSHSTKTAHRRSLQLESKSKSLEKTNRKSTSGIDSLSKSTSGMPIRKQKNTSELDDRKRLSSDPSHPVNKKTTISEACNVRKAKVSQLDTKKEKSIAISDVKNKLKKKSEVINKKGPMKAVHPVDSMQKKRASIGRHTSSSQSTPPKVNKSTSRSKIISSTPNSIDNNYYMPKKPTKSKPVASSTPDGHNSKTLGAQIMSTNKKRNISCEISPVTMHANTNSSDERKDSPKRVSKLPTPKKCTTPNRQQGIPRYSASPKHNSSFGVSHQRSPKRLNRSLTDYQRYSPVCQKKSDEKIQQSPFKESNRDSTKVKPYKLISRLRRHSTSEFVEKENNYV
ncbi:serine-rich adhesin for platelets-like [Linepithema humile]|uniref:serine-rich adhesin for platelets-like n=1 Tax=Linepithema humile TaxID=83485 RepID=UPI0006236992|nr:PREDICTED: MATH and LRR domain-containing protein PFE0570w-like [Linepithema humile]XP_012233948.1 PREDICTED: MATH and LRR domain-containing protein PFE0570w-like [Linepithema humile]